MTKKKYTTVDQNDDEIDEKVGIVNIIVPRSDVCDLSVSGSSSASIKNFYREIRIVPDPCKPELKL